MKKRKGVTISLSEDERKEFEKIAKQRGVSVSELIRMAVKQFAMREEIDEAQRRLPGLLSSIAEYLDIVSKELQELKNWQRYNAYQATLMTEMTRLRLNNILKMNEEQYEQFKKAWPRLEKHVQDVIERLTGQSVQPWREE